MKCPNCGHILSDQAIKRAGATLMGKASGDAKRRSKAQATNAAKARWEGKTEDTELRAAKERIRKLEAALKKFREEQAFSSLRTLAGVRQPAKRRPKS